MRKLLVLSLSTLILALAGCSGTSAQDDYACSTTVTVRGSSTLARVAADYWPGDGAGLLDGYPSRTAWEQEVARRNRHTVVAPLNAGEQLLIPRRCDAKPPSSK